MLAVGRSECPPFYCTIEYISAQVSSCKVVVVKRPEQHATALHQLLTTHMKSLFGKYIPWRQYSAMAAEHQASVIAQQNECQQTARSLLVSGFMDQDDIPMKLGNPMERKKRISRTLEKGTH
jgi:hypothetical protein